MYEPATEEEAAMRREKAAKLGKYGKGVETLVGRHKRGKEMWYEVK